MRFSRIRLSWKLSPWAHAGRRYPPCFAVWPVLCSVQRGLRFRIFRSRAFAQAALFPFRFRTCFQSGSFAPRALPRFFTTMGLSDSRPGPVRRLCLPYVCWRILRLPLGSPRFLDQSFRARCLQPPRRVRQVLLLVPSLTILGFAFSGRLATLNGVTRPNRVHLRCGSHGCYSEASPDGLLRLTLR